ncbi:MAG TPA: hypothetical protein VLE43_12750, partial [Candidatus Saccharimonadia bacterium]|nr:hypothetical protein [Candidatus Saccharimonadia bacterium]
VIAHGELDTGSFVHYDSTAVNAKQQATKLMQEQVDNRKDFGAYSQTFDSMDEVYAELTASEKAEILKAAPDPTKYMEGTKYKEGTDSPGYKADLELYDKVLSESLKQKQSQELDGGNVHKTSVRELMTKNESSKEAPTKLKVDENEEVDSDEPKVEAPHGTISVKEAMGKGIPTTTTTTPKVDSVNKITL